MSAYIKESNEERRKCLGDIVKKYPKQCRGYNGIANIYFIENDNDTAIEYYNKSIAINKFYNVAYYNIGNIYKAQKKTESAK
jgi:tetratricopeptide (TPR) repeat protein